LDIATGSLGRSKGLTMYRIITEDKNEQETKTILDTYAPNGYTVTKSFGTWKGLTEPSLVIDFVGLKSHIVYAIAERIKAVNNQDAVLVIEFPTRHKFI
jgi:hypothetical protein